MTSDSKSKKAERVEVMRDSISTWRPAIGEETEKLINSVSLDDESKGNVKREAIDVFSRCVSPQDHKPHRNTGLVIGYVQSGKTLSFTAVSALAHDNGYRMVIVITGTSIELTGQSQRRLRRDLRLETGAFQFRPWSHHHNPSIEGGADLRIKDDLAEWEDTNVLPKDRRTVLITVMKHHLHLGNLIAVLGRLGLNNVPALIIDDEADQAGLNNRIKEEDESTTYQRLRTLRESVPLHTFLQYTATPQGPLLINLIDVLSPEFAAVLTPGADYIGGKDLFTGDKPLIRDILDEDIPSPDNDLQEAPESLIEAMQIFFLGVASAYVRSAARKGNRSMMVHPSMRTDSHVVYFEWVKQIRESWMRLLESTAGRPSDPDRKDLLSGFRDAYEDLRQTVSDLEPLDQLVSQLLIAMRRTKVELTNSLPISADQIRWSDAYSWILVGGQNLDRGFTVEGLTVTYMPRGVGVGNADTIQQRARFFGYKRKYLGYCRVYLEPRVRRIFERYVTHEEDVRRRIGEHTAKGQPMRELRRAFLLDRAIKRPTRASILDVDYIRPITSDWMHPDIPHEDPAAIDENRTIVQELLSRLSLNQFEGHADRTPIQQHNVARNVPLQEIYDDFLTKFSVPNFTDNQKFIARLVVLSSYLYDHPDATCTIFEMSKGLRRERGVTEEGKISNLFQGESPVHPRELRGSIYPGDRAIRGDDNVTIQIHRVDIKSGTEHDSKIIAAEVPVVALWINPDIAHDALVQSQGGVTDTQ